MFQSLAAAKQARGVTKKERVSPNRTQNEQNSSVNFVDVTAVNVLVSTVIPRIATEAQSKSSEKMQRPYEYSIHLVV